jgi:hypothetical protein
MRNTVNRTSRTQRNPESEKMATYEVTVRGLEEHPMMVYAKSRSQARYKAFCKAGGWFPDGFNKFLMFVTKVEKVSDTDLPCQADIMKKLEQSKVDAWNAKYSIGQEVILTLDDGKEVESFTVGPAHMMGGHTAMVYVKEWGNYIIERISPK